LLAQVSTFSLENLFSGFRGSNFQLAHGVHEFDPWNTLVKRSAGWSAYSAYCSSRPKSLTVSWIPAIDSLWVRFRNSQLWGVTATKYVDTCLIVCMKNQRVNQKPIRVLFGLGSHPNKPSLSFIHGHKFTFCGAFGGA
jgi:hypothetical protein